MRPEKDTLRPRVHAVKAVGRRKRGRRPPAAPDFRKAVGVAGAGVRGVSRRIRATKPYRSGSRARCGVVRLRRWCA
jgi:hypothetical protein